MATAIARSSAIAPSVITLTEAQTGDGVTDNIADRGTSHKLGGTVVRIIAGAGATPTCTYAIEVSDDAESWSAATYADISTPDTDSTSTFQITTDSVVSKIIKHPTIWRYVRVTFSANTSVTNTVDVWFNDNKSFLND